MTEEQVPSFNERISRVSLRVAEHLEVQKAGHAAEEANQTLLRVKTAVDEVSIQHSVVSKLDNVPIKIRPVGPRLATSIGKATTALRRTSTALKDPEREVRRLLTTASMNSAIVDTERLLSDRETAIFAAFNEFKTAIQPEDLRVVQADGLQPLSLSVKVKRLQQAFNSPAPTSIKDVPEAVSKLQTAVSDWATLKAEVVEAQQRVPPVLQSFFKKLDGPQGHVGWHEIQDEVRSWLDDGVNGNDYIVVRRDRLA
jgi:hypothetical protein